MLRLSSRITVAIALFALSGYCCSYCYARDYDAQFVRNYPPGYYGMYYFAQRFFEKPRAAGQKADGYKWDRAMSRNMEIEYPFYPIPYPWDYGTGRNFALPDYNSNDWP